MLMLFELSNKLRPLKHLSDKLVNKLGESKTNDCLLCVPSIGLKRIDSVSWSKRPVKTNEQGQIPEVTEYLDLFSNAKNAIKVLFQKWQPRHFENEIERQNQKKLQNEGRCGCSTFLCRIVVFIFGRSNRSRVVVVNEKWWRQSERTKAC